MNREEMVEWLISKEPGNPKLQRFVDRKLYATDNSRTIDLLMMHAHDLAEEIRDFAAKRLQIDSDDETYGMNMAADLIGPKVEK